MSFFHYALRTTQADDARSFYDALLSQTPREIFPLHEQALARGARPHWLGFLEVDDVDRAAEAFVARGAMPLGPKWTRADGLSAAVLRGPGGAVIALGARPPSIALGSGFGAEVVWHVLNTNDVARARANYAELFGFEFHPPTVLGGIPFHPFSFERGGAKVGAFADIAGRPGVHPHWLFHVRVPDVRAAVEQVQSRGGIVAAEVELPNGVRVAVCDDPQGAAFAMCSAPPA